MSKQLIFNSVTELFFGIVHGEVNVKVDLPSALFLFDSPRSSLMGRDFNGRRAGIFAAIQVAAAQAEDSGRIEWCATEAQPFTTRTALRNLLVRNAYPGAETIAERYDEQTRQPLSLTGEDLAEIIADHGFALEIVKLGRVPGVAA